MMSINFQKAYNRDAWDIHVFYYERNMRVPVKISIERLPPVNEFECLSEPAMSIRSLEFPEVINALKEGLANAGLLQSSSASEAELKATVKHLEDMQRLVFNK